MTLPYQTLVRELTTPTLPTFVTSCLNLITSKSSAKTVDAPPTLLVTIFCSFATLLPHYPTLYRPEVSRIRLAAKPYLVPTLSDGFVPSSLRESARRLVVLTHLTAIKNTGGEEWGKAILDVVKRIHMTADQVFRAVVEDWESTVGYIGEAVDVNQELAGGSNAVDDLPPWTGIYAGVDRILGLLGLLEEYIKGETSTPVSIPVGAIMDVITRMLSIAIPASSEPSGGVRLHPAIDRDERDGLWSGMPHIYIAALQVVDAIADRLQEGFVPLATLALNQLTWIFSSGSGEPSFHVRVYHLVGKILLLIGKCLDKSQIAKLGPIIRSCCGDLQPCDSYSINSGLLPGSIPGEPHPPNPNGGTSLQSRNVLPVDTNRQNTIIIATASKLLPLFISHLPQKHLDIPLRSLIERTAILTPNKEAMLACIMNPLVGKDGRVISSIMPHVAREFGNDTMVELLLRPHMPLVPSTAEKSSLEETANVASEDENIMMGQKTVEEEYETHGDVGEQEVATLEANGQHNSLEIQGFGNPRSNLSPRGSSGFSISEANPVTLGAPPDPPNLLSVSRHADTSKNSSSQSRIHSSELKDHGDVIMAEQYLESDDESVHLTMELDTDTDEASGVDAQD